MSNVVKLELVAVGDGYRFDVDKVLDLAKGQEFDTLCIIGEKDGEIWIGGNANAGETMILLERAKQYIVFGD